MESNRSSQIKSDINSPSSLSQAQGETTPRGEAIEFSEHSEDSTLQAKEHSHIESRFEDAEPIA